MFSENNPIRKGFEFRKKRRQIHTKAIELLEEIGSGPGYPLDDCPKCNAAKKARDFINTLMSKEGTDG